MNECRKTISEKWDRVTRDERGLALLFTLGILSLLLVLALGFATNALTERKAAASYADATSATLMAESGLSRVLAFMNSSTFTDSGCFFNTFPPNNLFNDNMNDRRFLISYSAAANSSDHNDGLKTYARSVSGAGTDSGLLTWPDGTSFPACWQDITVDSGTVSTIVGRVAFIVVDETGKLDPRHVSSVDTARIGISANEINWCEPHGLSVVLGSPKIAEWDSLCKKFPDQSTLDTAVKLLFPFAVSEDESYITDTGLVHEVHRFNIARGDWGDTGIVDVDYIRSSPSSFTDTDNDGKGIPWLSSGSVNPSTFANAQTWQKQIIANLLDYCDGDNYSTTDNPSDPTYTGNEKNQNINEIAIVFHVEASSVAIGASPPNHQVTYSFGNSIIHAETIDIYGNVPACKLKILVGSLSFDYRDHTNNMVTDVIDLKDIEIDFATMTGGYQRKSTSIPKPVITFVYNGAFTPKVEKAEVSINRVTLLSTSGKMIDFSKPDNTGVKHLAPSGKFLIDSSGHDHVVFCYQTEDPRQNLNNDDWGDPKIQNGDTSDYLGWDDDNGTPDKINKIGGKTVAVLLQEASKDVEKYGGSWVAEISAGSGTDTPRLSTAYIANKPMASLRELGLIHRGMKWETINLKKFNTDLAIGNYSLGDANILEQVKLTSDSTADFKVNIDSSSKHALASLMYRVPVYETGNTEKTAITKNTSNVMAGNFWNNYGTSAGTPFKNRGEMARPEIFGDIETGVAATDAAQESVIGGIANLVSVKKRYYTAYILGQAIKDAGGVIINTILGERKIIARLEKDEKTNKVRIVNLIYVEE